MTFSPAAAAAPAFPAEIPPVAPATALEPLLRLARAQLEAATADAGREFEVLSGLIASLHRDYMARNPQGEGRTPGQPGICPYGRTLLDALATLQLHDLLRQRLDQVAAMLELARNAAAVHLGTDPDPPAILDDLRQTYVSGLQRQVHDALFPSERVEQDTSPDIELF